MNRPSTIYDIGASCEDLLVYLERSRHAVDLAAESLSAEIPKDYADRFQVFYDTISLATDKLFDLEKELQIIIDAAYDINKTNKKGGTGNEKKAD